MAPRRNAARKRKKALIRRRKNIQLRRLSRTHTTAGIRASLVKGVNALRAVTIDSAAFQPVADLVFKDLGVTKSPLSKRNLVNIETTIYGAGCAFGIPLSAIIKNAPQIPKSGASLLTTNNSGSLKHLRLTLSPSGPLCNRKGHWAMAFIPFTTVESRGYYERNTTIPTLQDVMLVPGAAFGLATQELSVNFRAKSNDFCCLSHPLTSIIGLVLISYNGISRNVDSVYLEGFGAGITVSGIVKLANPMPHVGARLISCDVTDFLARKLIRVNNFEVTNGKCEVRDGKLFVTGAFAPTYNTQNSGVSEKDEQPDGITTSDGGRKG